MLGVAGISFLALSGYYVWKIQHGGASELAKTFQNATTFTFAPGLGQHTGEHPPVDTFVRKENPRLGSADAPIVITMFIDFECPYSQDAYPIMNSVIDEYGGALQIVFKQFPLQTIHPHSTDAALASMCANEQGKFWEYYQLAFEKKLLTADALRSYATELHLNISKFDQCIQSQKYIASIEQDLQDGLTLGVQGTPTYFANDTKIEGVFDKETWKRIILSTLNT